MDSQQAQLALLESGHAYQVLQQRMQREMQVFNELIKWHTDTKQWRKDEIEQYGELVAKQSALENTAISFDVQAESFLET